METGGNVKGCEKKMFNCVSSSGDNKLRKGLNPIKNPGSHYYGRFFGSIVYFVLSSFNCWPISSDSLIKVLVSL